MLPAASGQEMVIEFLDQDLPVFYLIDLAQKTIIKELKVSSGFENLVLKSFSNQRLITQRFSDQNNPNAVEVFCFDWEKDEPSYAQINTQILDHGDSWLELPHPNFIGKTMIIDLDSNQALGEKPSRQEDENNTIFPTAYSDQSEYFAWFQKLLSKENLEIKKSCEFLKHGNKLIVSCYVIEEKKVSNYLCIFDSKGQLLDKFLLASGLKGIGKDTFFVCLDQLIFVTGKQTLNVVEL